MAPAQLPPTLLPGLPESCEAPPADSLDEVSDSDHSGNSDNSDLWGGQPWEVIIPSNATLVTTTYQSSQSLFDTLRKFCIESRMGLITL